MKLLTLTRGKQAMVDDEDFEELNRFKWYAKKDANTFYAMRSKWNPLTQKRTIIKMHRVIMNPPKGKDVDHINHDGLDQRKVNLRICTNAQNQYNQQPRSGCSSKFKGVSWHKRDRKWRAQIRIKGKLLFLGYYDSEIEAGLAYDKAAIKYFGEFANLNVN